MTVSPGATLARLRERKPLVHQITNYVVMNETANATLALGALPVMAHASSTMHLIVGTDTPTRSAKDIIGTKPVLTSSYT